MENYDYKQVILYYGNSARKLCHWMYNNSGDLHLMRKKERFNNHLRKRDEYNGI